MHSIIVICVLMFDLSFELYVELNTNVIIIELIIQKSIEIDWYLDLKV